MAKRLSVSSQPEELVRMTSEDIKNRKWTEAEKETSVDWRRSRQRGMIPISITPNSAADGGAACADGAAARRAAEAGGERASRSGCAGLAAVEGRGAPDADQRYSDEFDGGGETQQVSKLASQRVSGRVGELVIEVSRYPNARDRGHQSWWRVGSKTRATSSFLLAQLVDNISDSCFRKILKDVTRLHFLAL